MGTREDVLDYFKRSYTMNQSRTHSFEEICQQGRIEKTRATEALSDLRDEGLVEMVRDGAWTLTDAGLAWIKADY